MADAHAEKFELDTLMVMESGPSVYSAAPSSRESMAVKSQDEMVMPDLPYS
jgi:hypothetical protein